MPVNPAVDVVDFVPSAAPVGVHVELLDETYSETLYGDVPPVVAVVLNDSPPVRVWSEWIPAPVVMLRVGATSALAETAILNTGESADEDGV